MARPEVTGKKFLTVPQLQERWGGVSHMFIERLIRKDPKFPEVYRFGPSGRVRFFVLDDIEQYERAHVTGRRAKVA